MNMCNWTTKSSPIGGGSMANNMILILANGEWCEEECLHDIISSADTIIATDGAWAKAHERGIKVDLVIGDSDSLTKAEQTLLRSAAVNVLTYPREKDWTDLELALDNALAQEPDRIVVYGALGGRSDHALVNTLLLEKGIEAEIPIEMINNSERIALVHDHYEVPDAQIGDRISLLSLTKTVNVQTTGLKYVLNDELLERASSRGISNEVICYPVCLEVNNGLLLVIHSRCGSLKGGASDRPS